MAAARSIVEAQGHEHLTLRELATMLEVTPPAVYSYVENKEDLLRSLVQAEFARLAEEFNAIESEDPVELLRQISRREADFIRRNPALFRMMMLFPPTFFNREVFDDPTERPGTGNALFRRRAVAIRQAMDDGRVQAGDPYLLSLAIWTATNGVGQFFLMNPTLEPDEAEELVDLVVNGILLGLRGPDV